MITKIKSYVKTIVIIRSGVLINTIHEIILQDSRDGAPTLKILYDPFFNIEANFTE